MCQLRAEYDKACEQGGRWEGLANTYERERDEALKQVDLLCNQYTGQIDPAKILAALNEATAVLKNLVSDDLLPKWKKDEINAFLARKRP